MSEVYYALWSQMSGWNVVGRAAVVIGVLLLILWIMGGTLISRLVGGMLWLCTYLVIGIYRIIDLSVVSLIRIATRYSEESIDLTNNFASSMETFHSFLYKWTKKLLAYNGKRSKLLMLLLSIYCGIIFLIGLPFILDSLIHQQYIDAFSIPLNIYQHLEAPTIEKAKAYPPLFTSPPTSVDDDSFVPSAPAPIPTPASSPTPTPMPEIWLSLNDLGRKGANVRSDSNSKSEIITTLKRDDRVKYDLENNINDSNWIYIQLEDGRTGWMHDSLLELSPLETIDYAAAG